GGGAAGEGGAGGRTPAVGQRRDWHYVPRRRAGLALEDMEPRQRKQAHRLLAAVLSHHAYAQAAAIMAWEDVLDELEGGRRQRRGGDYAVSIFGHPAGGPWGLRVEGHHLSVNVTVAGGRVSPTPLFFGANPARVSDGETGVLRPLPAEERVARALLEALAPAQRGQAMISEDAPSDILTRNRPRVDPPLQPVGVAGADLGGAPAGLLRRLVGVYVGRVAPDLGWPRAGSVIGPERVSFAWAGSSQPGQPHYYRLLAPALLVEYANTQDDANHIHTVVRDPAGDFGVDLLAGQPAAEA
ncbi:MAG: DUF3500 domain-containing protein, partial [Actinomycetota bacterium]|nr:DUF3500 domain-containing protein [Actinomycetota bacterium]